MLFLYFCEPSYFQDWPPQVQWYSTEQVLGISSTFPSLRAVYWIFLSSFHSLLLFILYALAIPYLQFKYITQGRAVSHKLLVSFQSMIYTWQFLSTKDNICMRFNYWKWHSSFRSPSINANLIFQQFIQKFQNVYHRFMIVDLILILMYFSKQLFYSFSGFILF